MQKNTIHIVSIFQFQSELAFNIIYISNGPLVVVINSTHLNAKINK